MKTTNTEYFGIQRKIVASTTSDSWRNIPHVTYMYEPDVTDFYDRFKMMNFGEDKKITFNTLMLKVITEGLKAAPALNAHIHFDRKFVTGKIDTFENINISMPMILPNGEMMTINLRDFDSKNLDEMTTYIGDVKRRVDNTDLKEAMYSVSLNDTIKGLKKGHFLKTFTRIFGAKVGKCKVNTLKGEAKKEYESIPENDRLTIKDLEQGTVTISNIGSTYLGQRGATSLLDIVPPQVCAFAVGAVQKKPVVMTDANGFERIEVRKILPLCIAFDHRALDFGDIVPFMKKLDEIFENPSIMETWRDEERREYSVVAYKSDAYKKEKAAV